MEVIIGPHPLTITIPIEKQLSNDQKCSITKNSEEKILFIKDLIKNISSINISNLSNIKSLENVVDLLTCIVERAWNKNSKIINILKYSKSWWDMSCSRDLEKYRSSRSLANWKQFKKTVKNTKCSFFWLEDLRNIEQGKRALGTHELGQEKKSPSGWSYQVQWPSVPRNQ